VPILDHNPSAHDKFIVTHGVGLGSVGDTLGVMLQPTGS